MPCCSLSGTSLNCTPSITPSSLTCTPLLSVSSLFSFPVALAEAAPAAAPIPAAVAVCAAFSTPFSIASPASVSIAFGLLGLSSLMPFSPLGPSPPPFLGCGGPFLSILNACEASAPPANPPSVDSVFPFIPNICFTIFSAGTIKASATIAYSKLFAATDNADDTNTVYKSICIGCNKA